MAQYNFGVGDIFGLAADGSTPLRFGALQDISLDISADTKELYGRNQMPVDFARGKVKISGKISFGQIDPDIYNSLFLGQVRTVGRNRMVTQELVTVPANPGPYTCNAANRGTAGANFVLDMGVTNAKSGIAQQLVSTGPNGNQYSVSALGVYTFAATQAGKQFYINYLWFDATTGATTSISNQLMGTKPTFMMVLANTYSSGDLLMMLNRCVGTKLGFPLKQDDYTINDFEYMAQADDAGNVGSIGGTYLLGSG